MKAGDIVICRHTLYNFTLGKCYCICHINSVKKFPDDHILLYVIDDFGNVDAVSSYFFNSLSESKKTYYSIALVRKALLDYLFRGI